MIQLETLLAAYINRGSHTLSSSDGLKFCRELQKLPTVIYLGLDSNAGGIFIGANPKLGERAQQRPLLTPLIFVKSGEKPDWNSGIVSGGPKLLFLEEQYDLLSRLRRGRVYQWEHGGGKWYVHDPLRRDQGRAIAQMGYRFEMYLVTYQCDRLSGFSERNYPKVILGHIDHSTSWTIASIEGSAGGGPILTLRADSYLGLLPQLDPVKAPPDVRNELEDRLQRVVDSVRRLDPGTTIDCCRHALAIIFGQLGNDRTLDLGPSIEAYLKESKGSEEVRTWAGKIVARLHSRTKPNEAMKREIRALDDGDAQLAIECLAAVLKDVGWSAAG